MGLCRQTPELVRHAPLLIPPKLPCVWAAYILSEVMFIWDGEKCHSFLERLKIGVPQMGGVCPFGFS